MTTTGEPSTLTLRDIARSGDRGAATAQLDQQIHAVARRASAGAALSSGQSRSIENQMHAALDGALDRDVITVMAAGWQASSTFRAAARATAEDPTRREMVSLRSQRLEQTFHPALQIYIDDFRAATLELSVTVAIVFQDLAVAMSRAAIVGLDFGQCDVDVSVTSSRQLPLLHRSVRLTSNRQLPLPRPIPIRSAVTGGRGPSRLH